MESWVVDAYAKMHSAKIRQGELAKRIGVTRDYVNQILCGRTKPSVSIKLRIERELDEMLKEKGVK